MKLKRLMPVLVLVLVVATACASSGGDQPAIASNDSGLSGFLNGFIHGFVILFALISLIVENNSDTLLAEPVGSVRWYYIGYLIGVIVFFMIFPIGYKLRQRL